MLGTVAVVWGLILATIGDDPATGFTVAVVGWLIRRVPDQESIEGSTCDRPAQRLYMRLDVRDDPDASRPVSGPYTGSEAAETTEATQGTSCRLSRSHTPSNRLRPRSRTGSSRGWVRNGPRIRLRDISI